jgi:hypothetical protein
VKCYDCEWYAWGEHELVKYDIDDHPDVIKTKSDIAEAKKQLAGKIASLSVFRNKLPGFVE